MRRKSTRTSGKTSPEKGKQSDFSVKKSRRSSKRRRKSSESENSDEEQDTKHSFENESTPPPPETNTDIESNQNIIEKESATQDIPVEKSDKKFKLKRNRISNSDGNDVNSEDKHSARRSRRRGSPKVEERTQEDDDDEDNKGKGKSKSKTKSKIEKSEQLNEPQTHNESEISTNAQVTPQSPQVDNPNGVDVAQSAEDKNNDHEKEDLGSEDTKNTPVSNKEKLVHQMDNEIVEKEHNSVDKNEIITELSEDKTETNSEENEDKVQDPIKDAVTHEDSVNETINETNNEETVEETQVTPNDIPAGTVKSDEGFVGFAGDQVKQKHGSEFIEEPMDISMDVSFTIKTDDSSINITEAEETNEESTSEKISENLSKKPNINKKIQLIRDPNTKPVINRKKGWGSSTIALDLFTSKSVDTNVIQNIFTNIEFLDESEVKLELDMKDRRKSLTEVKERTRLERSVSTSDSEYRKNDIVNDEKEQEDNANIIAMNRKISIVDDSASKLKPPPSPAKNPISNVLFITNLVRPFTIKQLKELLERTGRIKENGFWTDKIKSKCYVQYEVIEDAEATRNALHGVHWPIGNGKKLIIDFANEDDIDSARNPPLTPPIPESMKIEKENEEPPKKQPKEPEEERIKEKIKEKRRHEHIREWDVGKAEIHRGRSHSREREKPEKRRHTRRSPSPFEDYVSRKQKKIDDHVPQKLMDDLFQKTKTTPSIYWQPLTPDEITTKQQQRLERMAEHKRRLEESTTRTRAEFGRGGPYRRRYD